MRSIYAYIGVIGSGKDYAAKNKSEELGGAKIFDFSDGVRDFTFNIIGYTPKPEDYLSFKNAEHILYFPITDNVGQSNRVEIKISGRKLLEGVGKTMRNYDKDFWVNYCFNKAFEFAKTNNPDHLVFNAVRYPNEASAVKELARVLGYDLYFIYTNYRSQRFELRDDESEYFAQKFLRFPHLTDITSLV